MLLPLLWLVGARGSRPAIAHKRASKGDASVSDGRWGSKASKGGGAMMIGSRGSRFRGER